MARGTQRAFIGNL